MDNYSVFRYICLFTALACGYSASIGNSGIIVFPEDLEKIKSKISTLSISSNVNQTDSEVDPTVPIEAPELSEDDAEQILDKLGFNITEDEEDVISTRFGDFWSVENKIVRYQRYHGLPETGRFDKATKVSLKMPRCGVSDIAAYGEDYRWDKRSLTYYVRNFPLGVAPSTVKQLLRKAFNEWSKVTVLDFTESNNPRADIEIVFGGRHHQERGGSCREAFSDNTLGHATYPETGAIHFFTKFYFGSEGEEEFFQTAVHEIGHALGLDHSTSKASIMYPGRITYHSKLPQIDVEKIQSMYGRRRRVQSEPNWQSAARFCDLPKYDAVFYGPYTLHAIAGRYCYTSLSSSDPEAKLVSEKWPGAPDSIDAAFSISDRVFMFSGEHVWAFRNGKLDAGYPTTISQVFPGLPNNLDAVMNYKSQFIFAFKHEQVWRYNIDGRHVDRILEVSLLGLPGDIDAAVVNGSDGHQPLVFKGMHIYAIDLVKFVTTKYNNGLC